MQINQPLEIEQLLARIAAGEQAALRALIIHYTPLLGPYIFTFTRSKEQEEEILQDIFLHVWQFRETLSTIRNFQGFVYSMARNHALNALRSTMREYARREKWQALQSDDVTTDADQLSLIEEAIHMLPVQQQRAWTLSRREGMKYEQIAVEMKVSKEAVKKHIQRANASIMAYVLERTQLLLLAGLLTASATPHFF